MRLETKYKKKNQQTVKHTHTHTRRLNNMIWNNQWIIEEIKEETEKYLQTYENNSTMIQNICSVTKAVLGGAFVEIYFLP